jgi:hypothetical protein
MVIVAVFILTLLAPAGAGATTLYWVTDGTCDTGVWDNGSCWTTNSDGTSSGGAGQPQAGDTVNLYQADSTNRSINYINTLYPTDVLHTLRINAIGTGTTTLSQSQDQLSAVYEYIGSGAFIQSGGTNTISAELSVGRFLGSAIYELSGTGTLSAGSETIGFLGTGTFKQTGGTNTITNILTIGQFNTGTYNLSGTGTLSADIEYIGRSDTGTFTQTGGTNTITNDLVIGHNPTGNGTYNLSGTGAVSAGSETIGFLGTGTFTQTGGTNTVSGTVDIGNDGTGTYTQTGGINTIANFLFLGSDSTGSGTYNLGGTGTLSADREYFGYRGTGAFTQTGGTNTITKELVLGWSDTASGTYNLSGTGILTADYEFIGRGGSGTFIQTGGTNTVTNNLTIASTTSSATYDLSGGTLTAGNIINKDTFNYSGGALNADVTNNAAFNLSGAGTRTVNGNISNTATGTVNVTSTTAVFTGSLTNDGAFVSALSDNYFTDLNVGTTGYLTGATGDNFYVSNDFMSSSTQNTLWDTVGAYLEFQTGADSLHSYSLTGVDTGAVTTGYTNNFAWDTLALALGNSLTLLDDATLGGALYVNEILGLTLAGLSVSNITGGGLNIYYMASLSGNAYLGGLTYDLMSGGQLIAIGSLQAQVPEPSTMLLLGCGLAGLGLVRKRFKQ